MPVTVERQNGYVSGAAARVPGLSVERSLTALATFLAGAAFGGG
jgi:hypothetical protein